MKIGDRIRKYRKIRKATQLDLGYHVKLSDLRIGQYETGKRNPKDNVIDKIAHALDVEASALKNNDIDSVNGLLHILFELEDVYGLSIKKTNGTFTFQFIPSDSSTADELSQAFESWITAYNKYHPDIESEEERQILEDKYALWKAQFPNNLIRLNDEEIICREDKDVKL